MDGETAHSGLSPGRPESAPSMDGSNAGLPEAPDSHGAARQPAALPGRGSGAVHSVVHHLQSVPVPPPLLARSDGPGKRGTLLVEAAAAVLHVSTAPLRSWHGENLRWSQARHGASGGYAGAQPRAHDGASFRRQRQNSLGSRAGRRQGKKKDNALVGTAEGSKSFYRVPQRAEGQKYSIGFPLSLQVRQTARRGQTDFSSPAAGFRVQSR